MTAAATTAKKIPAPTGTPAKTTTSANGANANPATTPKPTPKETTVKTATKPATKKAAKAKTDRSQPCGCRCGGRTKGGRFLPGHDAKLKSQALAILRGESPVKDAPGVAAAAKATKTNAGKAAEAILESLRHEPANRTLTPCECGCGADAARRFLPGHDAKLKSALVKAALGGDAEATAKLETLGWSHFLVAAQERANAKAAAKAAKAAEKAAAKANA